MLSPIVGTGVEPSAPWRVVGLPRGRAPLARFTADEIDGRRALRIETDRAYGTLVHELPRVSAGTLTWRWRVDQPVAGADLRQRAGDDAAIKVCALFALPDANVPFIERQLLRFARAITGEPLPAATLCYVGDAGPLAPGTLLPNAYTRRVRYLVLESARGRWIEQRRDLAADFLLAFGDESQRVPPLTAVLVGADSDNTGGRSLAWIDGLSLVSAP